MTLLPTAAALLVYAVLLLLNMAVTALSRSEERFRNLPLLAGIGSGILAGALCVPSLSLALSGAGILADAGWLRTLIVLLLAACGLILLGILLPRILASSDENVTEEEIISLLNEGHEHGVIDQAEAEMISNIFEFSEKEAKEIMTHRNDMIALDDEMTLEEAVSFMLKERNSRFPVYHEDIDHITGILHMRDAVKCREENPSMKEKALSALPDIARAPTFVTQTKNIDALFSQMQQEKLQMVIVIDEYGQTAGLIAMEDILEEIVGNIMDEYDVDENHIAATSNKNEFLIDGRTPLEELSDRFGIRFEDERFETLNGFLIAQMDHIPKQNEHFSCDYGGYRFHVLLAGNNQVKRVLLTRLTA